MSGNAGGILAKRVLDLAEQQGLLDARAIASLRQKVAESKFVVTPEVVAKVLVDHGHLTPFQARRLVDQALGPQATPESAELGFSEVDDTQPTDDEIVELEPVDPAPSEAPQPTHSDRPRKRKRPSQEVTQPLPPPPPGGLVKLTDENAPPVRHVGRWVEPVDELVELPAEQPIGTMTSGLQPLDDLTAADPLLTADPLNTSPLQAPAGKLRKGPRNVWDSPLLLIGGGILGVTLVAFALLLYALTRGSAAELLEKANEDYRAGSYTSAIAGYQKFADKYPDEPDASLARVRIGMATLRQVTDDGKNPRLGLKTAKEVLPRIESEERFADARIELSSILPNIADGFAEQATKAEATDKKEELVALAGEAMELVNNPAYLPASLRKDRDARINEIQDKLKVAARSIQQDKDLAQAVEQIGAAAAAGKAAEAYGIRSRLLRLYPSLEANEALLAAILAVGEAERDLVSVSTEVIAATTEQPSTASSRVIVASREMPGDGASGSTAGEPVFVLAEGAVYGFDVASGRVLWRRFVGYESVHRPQALADENGSDALVIDARARELLRLRGTTGELVWRQPLQAQVAAPVIGEERIYVTTDEGRILEIDPAKGDIVRSAQLPQGANVPLVIDARRSRLLQLGEHSTLFVLELDTLACAEAVYLGHKTGSVLVPPVAVLDLLVMVESPSDDATLLRVLSPQEKSGRLGEIGRSIRLQGRVVTPLSVSGRRFAVMTDQGQVAIFDVDPANRQQPMRQLAGLEAGQRLAAPPEYLLTDAYFWIGSGRLQLYEVQASLQQLKSKWVGYQNDAIVGALQAAGRMVVHVRRRAAAPGVVVEACNVASAEPRWSTTIAAPIASLAVSESRKTVDLLTASGRLYSLNAEALRAGVADAPAFAPPKGSGESILPEPFLSPDEKQLAWTEAAPGRSAYVYDVAAGSRPLRAALPADAAASGQMLGSWLAVPLVDGSVALVEPNATRASVAPFLPQLKPDSLPQWTRPAVSADGGALLISDGRSAIYRLVLNEQPQKHLAATTETATEPPVVSPLVRAAEVTFGIARSDTTDAVVGFDGQGKPAFEPVPLQGRLQSGPFAAAGMAFVAAEPDGLVCLNADGSPRWQQPLQAGPLAGPLVATPAGELLAIHQSGVVRLLDSASGEALATVDIGEPLGGPARILGQNLFLGGSDGVLHRVKLPNRP